MTNLRKLPHGNVVRQKQSFALTDLNRPLEQPNAEEIAYRSAQAKRKKAMDAAIKAAEALQSSAGNILRSLKSDDPRTANNGVKLIGGRVDNLERLINQIED